ncbi:conjugative transfer signal peptidase TraF (plasmid) [Bradyrhizobium japonicum]|jgi:conjugative transfer signal peptidase TraF|nr:conjugative transfer signal peptidase TraF [Bradyrhizobium japonicum]UQE03939.1 conjugative transfer signal peptidase TraF [Bradyrhizobium japonicum]UQE03946.1 conjugative transfer signal peptidase TraF [Bradyrhizobium japonicum]
MISIIDRRVVSQVADAATGKKTAVQRRRASAIMAAGGVAMIAIAGIASLGGLRLNLTPSEPLGLWRIVSFDRQIAVGDLVFVCPPAGSISAFGLERGYFRRGSCSGGAAPLIKTVVALAGARIDIGAVVMIDGVLLPRSRLSPVDGQGRPLPPGVGGVVPSGNLFLHSPFAGSYDSRYFGAVPEAGLLGLARPILTVDP